MLRWYLLVLLTGEHPAIPGTKKPFSWRCNNFRSGAPHPLRAFLGQQAEANLTQHGITEPVTWEPPPHWVSWANWPGTDPDRIPAGHLTALLEAGRPVHDTAAAIGLTAEHVRLWCELTSGGAPATAARGTISRNRADILAPARLRELYERQNVPLTEIGAMAGCATATIRRLLDLESAARFTIIDRTSTPLAPTAPGREFLQEASQILRIAQQQGNRPDAQLENDTRESRILWHSANSADFARKL